MKFTIASSNVFLASFSYNVVELYVVSAMLVVSSEAKRFSVSSV